MDSRKLKRRRFQQAYEDAEVNEEFEQEAVAPDEIAVPEETDIIDRNEGATTSLESNFKESVAKRILSEAAAKLAKAKEGLAIALSEEAATRVELDKLSSNVIAWREKVAEAERELADVERNVSFCNQQQIKFFILISCHSDRM